MKYCSKCVIPDTRPQGKFDGAGVCYPCLYAEQRNSIDFELKLMELRELISHSLPPNTETPKWDCIVGVSGGKDSTRQALWAREKLGLNPLLVSVAYPPRQISHIGTKNLSNLNRLGFDLYVLGPSPVLSRELVREAFLSFSNWCKATEMALFSGVPRLAHQLGINLILWGENAALQVGDQGAMGQSEWDGNNLINSNTLGGGNLDWFHEVADNPGKLAMYRYPSKAELVDGNIKTIFLGPAWSDWSSEVNSFFSIVNGFLPRGGEPVDTGDPLGTQMVDEDWTIVNFLLKFYKLGFARASEYASEKIRSGQITREEGIEIAENLDGACSEDYISTFCEYIGIGQDLFWATVRKSANADLFDLSGEKPVKRFRVGVGLPR